MQGYLDLLADVLHCGQKRPDRTGMGTRSVFGRSLRCDLSSGFPLLTSKRVFLKGIIAELLWFLRGSSNVRELQQQGVQIWDAWAAADGDVGPIYGVQWRNWGGSEGCAGIDQMAQLVQGLRSNPYSRRHLVSSWNVAELKEMRLPPCHVLMQFYVSTVEAASTNRGRLSCQLYQRSGDIFLGVPFNIASYALLTQMLAQVVGLELGELICVFGDLHLYNNHLQQAEEQLTRTPRRLPQMQLNPQVRDLFGFGYEDFTLHGYEPHPPIKAAVVI